MSRHKISGLTIYDCLCVLCVQDVFLPKIKAASDAHSVNLSLFYDQLCGECQSNIRQVVFKGAGE